MNSDQVLKCGKELDDDFYGSRLGDFLIEAWLRIRSKSQGIIDFKLNRAQREYSSSCSERNIVLKARQLGITTYVAARFFLETVMRPGMLSVQVAHDQESAEDIFQIVHRFWENLPEETRCGALVTSRANVRQIVFPRLDSEYRVATAADVNAGRGTTINNLHCSEVARWPGDGAEVLASLRAAVPENGQIVLESTPNGAGGVFYEEWQRAEETGYTRHFFPWWYDDSYSLTSFDALGQLTAEELQLVEREKLTDAQIAWRRVKWAQLRSGLAAQEYAEDAISCFRASGECVFELDAIDRALEFAGEPVEKSDNDRLKIWLPPQPGKDYVIGVDPAGGGTNGDLCCAEVIERSSGLHCAELHGHFPVRELGTRLRDLAARYNDALLAVERNNHGHAVLEWIRQLECKNVFSARGRPGWLTDSMTRPYMIENFASVLTSAPEMVRSERLLQECRTFVRHRDGSTGASSGSHDDCVMAMAIALAVRADVAGKASWSKADRA